MNQMLCGYRDDRRLWEAVEQIAEEDELLTPLEKRLEWICDEWQSALTLNTHEDWKDLRMMLHGATMALIDCHDRFDDRQDLSTLNRIAFENSLECIRAGRYEGAPK